MVTYCSVRWNGIIYWINAKQFSDHIGGKISLEATPKQNNNNDNNNQKKKKKKKKKNSRLQQGTF